MAQATGFGNSGWRDAPWRDRRDHRSGFVTQAFLVTVEAQTLFPLVLVDLGFTAFLERAHGIFAVLG